MDWEQKVPNKCSFLHTYHVCSKRIATKNMEKGVGGHP